MGVITKDIRTRWPGGCIPYRIHPVLANDQTMNRKITNAIQAWETRADVRFVKRTTQTRFVHFKPDPGPLDDICTTSSHGMSGGETTILLEPNKSEDTIKHEIGHAMGFYHEQKRPDRDQFIAVNDSQTKWLQKSQFEKLAADSVIMVGTYDLDSVMHYGCAKKMSLDGQTCLITTIDPADQNRIGNRDISPTDVQTAAELNKGNLHVFQLSSDGQIESVIQQSTVTAGWTNLSPFSLDLRTFQFRYKQSTGTARISEIRSDGSINLDTSNPVDNLNLDSGWTTAFVYGVGLKKYLLVYKAGDRENNGAYKVFDIDLFSAKISRNPSQEDSDWDKRFTSILPYNAGGDRMVAYRVSNGNCAVTEIEWDGKIGGRLQFLNLNPGFNLSAVYSADGRMYYLRMRTSDGGFTIRRIRNDGTIGAIVHSDNLSPGWTTIHPYIVGSNSYILLVNSTAGDLQIRRIRSDGRIGAATDNRRLNRGWTVGTIYGVGIGTYVNLVKTG